MHKKYMILSGFDPVRAANLERCNKTQSRILRDMCHEAFYMMTGQRGAGLHPFHALLGQYATDIKAKDSLSDKDRECLRACMRVRDLIDVLENDGCIMARNIFLDRLNIKQIVWHVTGVDTMSTRLGTLGRAPY